MTKVLVMVGTVKGAFFLWSDAERRQWRVEGPLIRGWEVTCLAVDQRRDPVFFAGVASMVYGPTVHRSTDHGSTWSQIEAGPQYSDEQGRTLERIWSVVPGHPSEPQSLYAGVAEAGLFLSSDSGNSWQEVQGLNDHPTRSEWSPGAGGLCCHTVLIDPNNKQRLWVGISAVGVFRSDDGGQSWEPKNEGVPIVIPSSTDPRIGSCVHKLVLCPENPDLLYQQNHLGVFRTENGGDRWQRIEEGVPSSFGFPMVMHPRDSRTLFVIPLESDEYRYFRNGEMAVYRTRDGGESWHSLRNGLPSEPCYSGVLRGAMSVDSHDECGVYFGTTGGQLFFSRDVGENWQELPCRLPRISSVTAVCLE